MTPVGRLSQLNNHRYHQRHLRRTNKVAFLPDELDGIWTLRFQFGDGESPTTRPIWSLVFDLNNLRGQLWIRQKEVGKTIWEPGRWMNILEPGPPNSKYKLLLVTYSLH